jgi:hypothetical protein
MAEAQNKAAAASDAIIPWVNGRGFIGGEFARSACLVQAECIIKVT